MFEVLDFYEHVGLLVKKGHLEIYDVWHTFYEWAQPVYVDMQQLIESPESAYADHYGDLRKLMRAMDDIQIKRMHENNANHWALWTPDRILQHYRYELEVSGHSGRSTHSVERRAQRAARERAEQERLDLDAEANEVLVGEASVAAEARAENRLQQQRETGDTRCLKGMRSIAGPSGTPPPFAGRKLNVLPGPGNEKFREAHLIDGQELARVHAVGKHLGYEFANGLYLHVHLGRFGDWTEGLGPLPEPRGALRVTLERRGRKAGAKGKAQPKSGHYQHRRRHPALRARRGGLGGAPWADRLQHLRRGEVGSAAGAARAGPAR